MNKTKAKEIIKQQIDQIKCVAAEKRYRYAFEKWFRDTRADLEHVFPAKRHSVDFSKIRFSPRRKVDLTENERQEAYEYGLERSKALLDSCINEIEKFWDEEDFDFLEKYISDEKIEQLKEIETGFDLSKLLELCRELNINYSTRNYYAVIMLVRTIIDHVPPIMDCKSFGQYANEVKGNTLKKMMLRLEDQSRKVADILLHEQIGKKHPVPTKQQVDFRSEIGFLLDEVIKRIS